MATKEEREAAALAKQWAKAARAAAIDTVENALANYGLALSDQGGLVVTIPDAEGTPRRYFVSLTEART